MTNKHHHKPEIIRSTIGVPKKKHRDTSDKEFNKLLEEFLIEKAPMLKRLAKK